MIRLLKKLYHHFIKKRNENNYKKLIDKGLKVGKNVDIMGSCDFDTPHCFLISIGDNCTLAPHVRLIAHDASLKKIIGYTKIGKIQIGNDCFIGDSAVILPGVKIGDRSIIGAGSVVTRDIPAGSVAAGNPCTVLGAIDQCIQKNNTMLCERKAPYCESGHSMLNDLKKEQVISFLENGPGYIR